MVVAEEQKKEDLVVSWLRTHGYYRVTVDDEVHIIEADGKMRRMIVGIRTPENKHETADIQEIADSKHKEPWVAVVEPDNYISWFAV